ncbi:MAG: aspartate/glutamate racemase family protein [Bacillota bacterium]
MKLIRPVVSATPDEQIVAEVSEVSEVIHPGLIVHAERLKEGPSSIQSQSDAALAAPGVVQLALKAQDQGYHAAAIYCFADPGLEAARERVNIPVAGAGESSLLIASSLALKFSVITVLGSLEACIYNTASRLGIKDRMVSVRWVGIPVPELGDRTRLMEALRREALDAITKDGAHCVVLGCTGMAGVAYTLEAMLLEEGFKVPVVDPAVVCVSWGEMLARLQLKHSKLTYCG